MPRSFVLKASRMQLKPSFVHRVSILSFARFGVSNNFLRSTCSSIRTLISMESSGGKSGTSGAAEESNGSNQIEPTRAVAPHVAARRRERPPLSYTDDFQTPDTVNLNVIGVVRSPYKVCWIKSTAC